MLKRVAGIAGGVVLIAVFLAWMLFKGTEPVRHWLHTYEPMGIVAWGIAWLCLAGGAWLIARAIARRGTPEQQADAAS